jgi:hypothetical protein
VKDESGKPMPLVDRQGRFVKEARVCAGVCEGRISSMKQKKKLRVSNKAEINT